MMDVINKEYFAVSFLSFYTVKALDFEVLTN